MPETGTQHSSGLQAKFGHLGEGTAAVDMGRLQKRFWFRLWVHGFVDEHARSIDSGVRCLLLTRTSCVTLDKPLCLPKPQSYSL